jgi:response regulator RpfG family c-di-GMP phosphodiesterase
VDDELSILAGFQRHFRKQFEIVSALNGTHALETLTKKGPFAAVMSDFNMPGMNGLTFLRRVREQSPESVRLMLSGKADAEAGLAAVNDGTLFRFLSKPCPPEVLAGAFTAALEQYRLITARRIVKEQMVESGISLMSEVQKHLQPEVVERASRIQATVQRIVLILNIAGLERFEVAAMLSHIGCIGVPAPLLKKVFTNGKSTQDEESALMRHAEIGARIIANVPGLETVAEIVRRQFEIKSNLVCDQRFQEIDPILLGSQLLRLAGTFDSYLRNLNDVDALDKMSFGYEPHDPVLLSALRTVVTGHVPQQRPVAFLNKLEIGMLTPDNIVNRKGYLLAAKGVIISAELFAELQRHAAAGDIDLPV